MAGWGRASWPPAPNAPTHADRRGGDYERYQPDRMLGRPLLLAPDVSELAWRVEAAVRGLGDLPGSRGLEGLARFLLRWEAIASSRIEGLQVSPQQVGLAELAEEEQLTVERVNRTARRVAANISALRQASYEVAAREAVGVTDVVQLQEHLLADEPRLHGLRDEQNWVGGSDHHPLGAEFVPPPAEDVPELMADLVGYLNTGDHAPLVQAALVHAQFETVHPFRDGNGRVGRALIHTVLVRRGLTRRAVLPISPVLLTRSDEYVRGLTAYRYSGPPSGSASQEGVSAWLRVFLQAVDVAVTQAREFAAALDDLRAQWEESVAGWRRSQDLRQTPRAGSATARLLETLQEHPVLTAAGVMRLLDVSRPAATAALDELAQAGVLSGRRLDGRTGAHLALDVFELITSAERRLASTRWDTRASAPLRATPYRPQRPEDDVGPRAAQG